jgi:hypothetical protein
VADFDLPRTLTLPSGRRATLRRAGDLPDRGPGPDDGGPGSPRFASVLALLRGSSPAVLLEDTKTRARIEVEDLALADFHVVRAILTKAKLAPEEEVEVECHNCDALLVAAPCAGLEVGPWEDGELGDPELDRTEPLGAPIPTAPVTVGRVRVVRTMTLAPRTVREALPLFAALARDPFVVDEEFVSGMGILALGAITAPTRIARILSDCDDASFAVVTDTFLAAHYPLRLGCDVFCASCGARNTIDAPALREFERGLPGADEAREGADTADGAGEDAAEERAPQARSREAARAGARVPPLETFVELAHAIAEPLIAELPGEPVELIVEDGTPAVDDGGVPLLGSYVPPPAKDAPVPSRPPTVTIYYRTFVAIERDEGPFDWEDELEETIEHELEHHLYFLRGDDPMDEEEHAEIDREALRVVGRAEATRRTLAVFGLSIPDFFVRAWPLVLLAAVVLAITLAEGRCAP